MAGKTTKICQVTLYNYNFSIQVVGITDLDADIRYCVMMCLDECFDFHLAQAENLSALFVALNDEQFEIRELTMCIIGRLSILNPAYIMPSLRNTLLQLLTGRTINDVFFPTHTLSWQHACTIQWIFTFSFCPGSMYKRIPNCQPFCACFRDRICALCI